jgi:hypothetical protein
VFSRYARAFSYLGERLLTRKKETKAMHSSRFLIVLAAVAISQSFVASRARAGVIYFETRASAGYHTPLFTSPQGTIPSLHDNVQESTFYASNDGRIFKSPAGSTFDDNASVSFGAGEAVASAFIGGEGIPLSVDGISNLPFHTGVPKIHLLASAGASANGRLSDISVAAEAYAKFQDTLFLEGVLHQPHLVGLVLKLHGEVSADYSLGPDFGLPDLNPASRPNAYMLLGGFWGETFSHEYQARKSDDTIRFDDGVVIRPDLFGHTKHVSVSALLTATANNQFGNVTEHAKVDFKNTIEILGIIPYDSDGNILPSNSLTITSESGLIYPVLGLEPLAAPEPGTLTLAGLGVVGLVASAWRQRRRRNSV